MNIPNDTIMIMTIMHKILRKDSNIVFNHLYTYFMIIIVVPFCFFTCTGFPRPRYANFSWANFDTTSPFDPTRYYSWMTETTVWQYTFSVPHNVEGMIRAYGGEAIFLKKLDEFFEQGHYNHGNEPDHHVLFLYAYVPEAVWKIQHYLPKIITNEYGPTGDIIGELVPSTHPVDMSCRCTCCCI